jgi:hypothetical protein
MNRPRWAAKAILLAGLAGALGGCETAPGLFRPAPARRILIEDEEAWRAAAAADDQALLDSLPARWTQALADARRFGFARRIASEGPLLDPAAALPRAAPSPGAYLCRVVRFGTPAPGLRPWIESAPGFCFVGVVNDQLSLTMEAGPQRIGGYLWEEKGEKDLVFLGAASPRGTPLGGYGDDPARDAVGRFERIGNFRYRLVLPWGGVSRLAIFELSPAPGQ